ncbi:MAG TPA: hypothetical protein VFA74_18855 [Terriglobales bacterium]|nr:hypothetical protein [Terriglobales bacterium]
MRLEFLAFYGGPDQVMTVTSGVASLLGLLLMFWNKVTATFFKIMHKIKGSPEPVPSEEPKNTSAQPPKNL